ncbi:hypothetical protein GCM10009801_00600 [Streptomyces albiaxialis]|uniref:Integral membrane protein n=1 Tax=Streptomyces albiaxialis TaxID=329523 RepID=A0ABN2VE06_9ACTN
MSYPPPGSPHPMQQQAYPPQQGVPPQVQAQVPEPPRRPAFVVVTFVVTMLSAVFALIGAIIVYSGGKDFVDEHLRKVMDENPEAVGLPAGIDASDVKSMSGPIWNDAVTDYQDTLTIRAGMAVFFAVLLLLFAVFVLRTGARWARVLITIVAAVQFILPHTLILGDEPPDSLFLTSFPAVLLGLLALIFVWLPPVGRYGKGYKLANSPQARMQRQMQGQQPMTQGQPQTHAPRPQGHRRRH